MLVPVPYLHYGATVQKQTEDKYNIFIIYNNINSGTKMNSGLNLSLNEIPHGADHKDTIYNSGA